MPQDTEWLAIFSAISLAIFVGLVLIAFTRMFWRLGQFIFLGVAVPSLLKRDLLLFGSFFIVFGIGSFLRRILGLALTQEPVWIVPTTLFALGATAYWVWVEFHLES